MNRKEIHAFYTYLQSQQTAQEFLSRSYQRKGYVNAEAKSYENCNTFIYYLDHGIQFYKNGKDVPTVLQPILLFYGMVHLLKACLLTIRPDYPETTKILAHGVSTRKRKKKQYTFMKDQVKIQHNGLFPYVSEHLFSKKSLPMDTFKMDYLFSLIPEMAVLFDIQRNQKMTVIGQIGSSLLTFPNQLLDSYHLTSKAFIQRVSSYLQMADTPNINHNVIQIKLKYPIKTSSGPFFFSFSNNKIYFPNERFYFLPISEIMIHYLLLYNLSMLCRYETEWWGDLLVTKPEMDYPFIVHFLEQTSNKIPLLLGMNLYEEHLKH